jgi:hypothetical protein
MLSTALRGVGRAEALAGHPATARDAFDRARGIDVVLGETYPTSRYNAACCLAMMIPVSDPDRRESLALQAVEMLRMAIAARYGHVAQIKDDPDLEPLRARADFQAVLTSVETSTAPKSLP